MYMRDLPVTRIFKGYRLWDCVVVTIYGIFDQRTREASGDRASPIVVEVKETACGTLRSPIDGYHSKPTVCFIQSRPQ